jgi:predicted DNA binding protein
MGRIYIPPDQPSGTKYVRLSLTHDPAVRHPMHQFVVAYDGYEASNLLQVNYSEDVTDGEFGVQTSLFQVVGSPIDPSEAALPQAEEILEYDLSARDDESFYVYVRSEPTDEDERLVGALQQSGLVVMTPVEYRSDGTIRLTLVGPGDAVQRSLDEMPAEVGVDVRSIGEYDARHFATGGDLADRQFEAVEAAVEYGYYEEPRTGSVADVAEDLGCAPGTAAEHLRRAEASVMADLVSE